MKNLILTLLVFAAGYSVSAQGIQQPDKSGNLLIKAAPAKLAFQSFGLGVEYMPDKDYSLEVEGTVKNILPQFPMNPIGYTSENESLYFEMAARMKTFYTPAFMRTGPKYFNGLYIAPGIVAGTESEKRNDGAKLHLRASFDIGYMLAETNGFVLEVFGGYETTPATEPWLLVYRSSPRLGVRMGVAI